MFLALPQRLLTHCESTHDVLETIEGAEQTAASKAPVLYRLCQHLIYINTSVACAAGSSVNRTIAPRLKCEHDLVMIELNCEKNYF
jgi:hypothetical protein